ncbi:MAG: dipicolinate synthase subunit B [Butyricicoccus sp.]
MTEPIRLGFALTGSFCTFARVLTVLEGLAQSGRYEITPILSFHAAGMDTRFGTAADVRARLEALTGRPILDTIQAAEPIGPKGLLDVLVIAPCTGNTLAKLTYSIIDTPVTMAAKSHLRRGRPVVLAVSTNDGLSGSAANIGTLLNRRHYYFVPFGQDAPEAKPRSLVADMERIPETVEAALRGEQLQPILSAR